MLDRELALGSCSKMAEPSSSSDSKPSGWDITSLPASTGKAWEGKVSEASKAWDEQVKSAGAAAEAALDAGVSAVSAAVRSTLSAARSEGGAVAQRAQQFIDTGAAHLAATEAQAVEALRKGVHFVSVEHREASVAGGVALAAVLLSGPRRFLLRKTFGRFRSEEAMFKSAEMRYGTLKSRVEEQQGELLKLQDRLSAAEQEYARGLAKLKSTAGELESLGSHVESSSKAVRALVTDLRQLPSKAALQLRSDAANTAAAASSQAKAVERSLRRVAKDYGI